MKRLIFILLLMFPIFLSNSKSTAVVTYSKDWEAPSIAQQLKSMTAADLYRNYGRADIDLTKDRNRKALAVANASIIFEYIYLKYGIPTSISRVCFIAETAHGTSKVFHRYNNTGGIRKNAKYKQYANLLEAADDWGKVMTANRYIKRYIKHKDWLRAFQEGGYWTDPNGLKLRRSLL
jgi:hypothetical protein